MRRAHRLLRVMRQRPRPRTARAMPRRLAIALALHLVLIRADGGDDEAALTHRASAAPPRRGTDGEWVTEW
jgi:hypothetical protein